MRAARHQTVLLKGEQEGEGEDHTPRINCDADIRIWRVCGDRVSVQVRMDDSRSEMGPLVRSSRLMPGRV